MSTRPRTHFLAFVVVAVMALGFLAAGSVLVFKGVDGRHQVTAQLQQEHITVTADAPNKAYANQPVLDGASAQAQADAIWEHMMTASNGKTYAQLPNKGPAATPDVIKTRATLQSGDALRSALLSSTLAWNVANLVIGLGIAFLGFGLVSLTVALLLRPRRVAVKA